MSTSAPLGDPALDPAVPNVARVYDFLLGGTNNFPADRELAQQLLAVFPFSGGIARQNRAFVGRAVRYCAGQGVRQFLDIGSGLPTMENVHEVVRRVIPDAAVVYVDNDPAAFAHASSLLATSDGVSALLGDAREPGRILAEVTGRGLLDLSRPLVVVLGSILHFIPDEDDPAGLVAALREAMPPGSYLVLSHGTSEVSAEDSARAEDMYRGASSPLIVRSRAEIAAYFTGLELAEPGLVGTSHWRPDDPADTEPPYLYAGVGLKP